jgi:hypothetical protein
MFILKVDGNTYKIAYTYGVIAKTDILDEVQSVMSQEEDGAKGLKQTLQFIPELLLYGLQKFHKDNFGFSDEAEKEEKLDAVYDIIDKYEEEHSTDDVADGEAKPDAFTLMYELIEELQSQGFLSRIALGAKNAAQEKATVVPMDHKKKKSPGAKQ